MTYSAFFVRRGAVEAATTILGPAETMADSDWALCNYRTGVGPPHDSILEGESSLTESLSEQLGEILFVYGDDSVDGFVYEHARDGELLRKLVWFPLLDEDWTAGWICAVGEPEDWEAVLFRPAQLDGFLEAEKNSYADMGNEDAFPAREAEVRAVWNTGRIVAGNPYPPCDGSVALFVERSYGIVRPL